MLARQELKNIARLYATVDPIGGAPIRLFSATWGRLLVRTLACPKPRVAHRKDAL
jgi:hypothetical protein